jgi:hypothetical protein
VLLVLAARLLLVAECANVANSVQLSQRRSTTRVVPIMIIMTACDGPFSTGCSCVLYAMLAAANQDNSQVNTVWSNRIHKATHSLVGTLLLPDVCPREWFHRGT